MGPTLIFCAVCGRNKNDHGNAPDQNSNQKIRERASTMNVTQVNVQNYGNAPAQNSNQQILERASTMNVVQVNVHNPEKVYFLISILYGF